MAPNPLKPLIKGLFGMLTVATVVLSAYFFRLGLVAEQERIEASRKLARSEEERREREFKKNQAEERARRAKEEAARRAAAAPKAEPTTAQARVEASALEEKKPPINLTTAFEKTLRNAAEGDPHAQYLVGFVYYVGMDKIAQVRESRLHIYNRLTVTTLTGDDLTTGRLVSVPSLSSDRVVAAKWLERAALQGHRGAQVLLAMEYLNSPRGDPKLAYQWLLTAEGPSIIPAEIKLFDPPPESRASMKQNVCKRLMPEQKAEAEKQAKNFVAKKENP